MAEITVTVPDDQAATAEEAFKAQGFEDVAAGLTDHVARTTVNYATQQAAQAAAVEARDATAAAFGTTAEALTPRGPGGPGGPRRQQ